MIRATTASVRDPKKEAIREDDDVSLDTSFVSVSWEVSNFLGPVVYFVIEGATPAGNQSWCVCVVRAFATRSENN